VRLGPHYRKNARQQRIRFARKLLAASVAGGVLVGIGWGAASTGVMAGLLTSDAGAATAVEQAGSFTCTVATITDGDTFRCSETEADGKQIRVRLSGVAAREKDGTCTTGHPCPDAPPEAAAFALQALTFGQPLQCRQVGSTYGRRAAFCSLPGGKDLSCAMVASGTVANWEKHWGGHRC
jgi:endonuclease YncB( thermonuclease family)